MHIHYYVFGLLHGISLWHSCASRLARDLKVTTATVQLLYSCKRLGFLWSAEICTCSTNMFALLLVQRVHCMHLHFVRSCAQVGHVGFSGQLCARSVGLLIVYLVHIHVKNLNMVALGVLQQQQQQQEPTQSSSLHCFLNSSLGAACAPCGGQCFLLQVDTSSPCRQQPPRLNRAKRDTRHWHDK